MRRIVLPTVMLLGLASALAAMPAAPAAAHDDPEAAAAPVD